MNKGIITVSIPSNQRHCIEDIRKQFESDNYKVVVIVSGNQDMKSNITEVAKARLNS